MELLVILLVLLLIATPILALVAMARTHDLQELRQRLARLERNLEHAHWRLKSLESGQSAVEEPRPAFEEPSSTLMTAPPEEAGPPDEEVMPGLSIVTDPVEEAADVPSGEPGLTVEHDPEPGPGHGHGHGVAADVGAADVGAAGLGTADLRTEVPSTPNSLHAPKGDSPNPDLEPTPAALTAAASSAPPKPAASARRSSSLELEQWLGVKGAALAGGILLALAGVLFVHHAIQQGWVGPGLRVTFASISGLACLFALPVLRARGYEVVGEALAGAGTVMLYGAAWSSYRLYGFVPVLGAFAWMGATTALALWLARRHDSRIVISFAAVGGFLTPLLLDTWRGNPFGLFGYLFLLNLGLLVVARQRGWRWVEWLALGGTVVLQFLWGLDAAREGNAPIGLGAVFVFSGMFAVSGVAGTRLAAACSAFALAFVYAARLELGIELWQLAIGIVPLTGLLAWASRDDEDPWVVLVAAGTTVGLALAWLVRGAPDPTRGWQYVGVLTLTGVVLTAILQRFGSDKEEAELRPEIGVLILALAVGLGLFILSESRRELLVPSLAIGSSACALLLSLAGTRPKALLSALVPFAFVSGIALVRLPDNDAALPAALLCAGLIAGAAWLRARDAERCMALAAGGAALLLPVLLVMALPSAGAERVEHLLSGPQLYLGFGALAMIAAAVGRSQLVHACFGLGLAVMWWRWDVAVHAVHRQQAPLPLPPLQAAFALRVGLALLYGIGPLVLRCSWYSAALFPLFIWAPWSEPWGRPGGVGEAWWLPLALGLATLAGAGVIRLRGLGRAALARQLAVAGVPLAMALAIRVDVAWPIVGSALALTAAACVARRCRHVRLFEASSVGLAIVIGLVALSGLASGQLRSSEWLVSPRLAWSQCLPALCGVSLLLLDRRTLHEHLRAALGLGTAMALFAWVNLMVFDAYEPSDYIHLDFRRGQAQNLVQSFSWAVFALALLFVGTLRSLESLRWLSLVFLLAALVKVSLWDLGELEGLYRVASLAGLAIALLGVSLLYQRFVFRRSATQPGERPVEAAGPER